MYFKITLFKKENISCFLRYNGNILPKGDNEMKKWLIALLKKMKFNVELFTDETGVKRKLSRADISKIDWNMFVDSLIYSSTVEKQPQYSKITKEDEADFFRAWDMLVEKLSDEETNTLIDGVSKAWNFPLPRIGDVGTLDNLLKMSDKHKLALEQSKKPNEYFAKGMHLTNNAGPLIENGSSWVLKISPYTEIKVKVVIDNQIFFYYVDKNGKQVIDQTLSAEEFRVQYRKGSFRHRKSNEQEVVSRVVNGEGKNNDVSEETIKKLMEYAETLTSLEDMPESKKKR